MNEEQAKKLSTDPYKGVRDFYPAEYAKLKYIFSVIHKTLEQFGYSEYNASILEPTELYKAKSGEEIVNEQTYSFKDRGDREVTLRPEMTPTVTRMVAAKRRELSFPLRWYSIPNLFRYEKPQRGRLREHYQLNVDLFGISSIFGEVEVIEIASRLITNYGASDQDFLIRINNRKILNSLFESVLHLSADQAHKATKLLDRKSKMSRTDFELEAQNILGESASYFNSISRVETLDELITLVEKESSTKLAGVEETAELITTLAKVGITNIVFDISLARGFDYYTGIVFEVFDTSPDNPRALCGGGRYDDLLSVFGSDKVPAVGFGVGDVGIANFLETHNLMPFTTPHSDLNICVLDQSAITFALRLADSLRDKDIKVSVDTSGRKVGAQIQSADKLGIPYILCIGEKEVSSSVFTVKKLKTGDETETKNIDEIVNVLHS